MPATHPADAARTQLRAGLRDAMVARDRTAATALRGAIAAIDNAEAVPASSAAVALEAVPVTAAGANDVPRRDLSGTEVRDILQAEIDERQAAATEYDGLHPDRAAQIRAEAEAIEQVLVAYNS
ncbi:hypothetical protein [Luteipulveratus mongoliensis]|nr:hypothetical protein [Luteipulveratus mongoliensis]